tara:strand:- start:13930 stop:14535 length:606 start_codon:yes stop_codon:yes gene_type:complete
MADPKNPDSEKIVDPTAAGKSDLKSEVKKPVRKEREVPTVPVNLDEKSEQLSSFLESNCPENISALIGAEADIVTITVDKNNLIDACNYLKNDNKLQFNYLSLVTVVDYEAISETFELNYHLVSLKFRQKIAIKCNLSVNDLSIPSISKIWTTANWFERESHDLFGVIFEGHPNLAPLLLYEEFEGFPGRKSFPFHDYQEW